MKIPDPQPVAAPVCILFALPEEVGPFQKRVQQMSGFHSPVSVRWSGAGRANTVRVAQTMHLEMARCLLICGFAGGLAGELTPGTLVFGERVTNSQGQMFKADSRLLATVESVRLPELTAMRGMIYTTDRVLTTRAEKQELTKRTDAVAVDMETYAAAQAAEAHHVPWLAVRVVTDGLNDDMPLDFNTLADGEGNVDKKRVIAATLAHPWKIPALIRLGARSSLAAKNLAVFLDAYLQALPDINV